MVVASAPRQLIILLFGLSQFMHQKDEESAESTAYSLDDALLEAVFAGLRQNENNSGKQMINLYQLKTFDKRRQRMKKMMAALTLAMTMMFFLPDRVS